MQINKQTEENKKTWKQKESKFESTVVNASVP